MKVIKDKDADYTPFHEAAKEVALESIARQQSERTESGKEGNLVEKYSYFFQTFLAFEKETERAADADELFQLYLTAIKRVVPFKHATLLYFDENEDLVASVQKEPPAHLVETAQTYYKEGVLEPLFKKPRTVVVPLFGPHGDERRKTNLLVAPLVEDEKRKGVMFVETASDERTIGEGEKQFLEALMRIFVVKSERFLLKQKLNEMYEELQTYQAKLSNDFRLAAIGELTEGIVEDIASPLQVIMSQVDLLHGEDTAQDVKRIKTQINKINAAISRLVKFSSLNRKNVKIQPIELNEVIEDYYNLVKSSLESLKLECVLDFEKDIPSILSHPNYIHQILANVLGLIKSMMKNEVGILIRTRYKEETIFLNVVSTSDVGESEKSAPTASRSSRMTMKIIENLMRKHEGSFTIESFEQSGSQITLKFPLKRKIRT
jgi:signal transduction histidine kinase